MKKFILLLVLCFGYFIQVQATHDAGADLTYTCIGGNDYLITLTFYRDCSGVTEPTTAEIDFTSSCTGAFSVVLNKVPPTTGVEVTPVCPGQITTCQSGGTLYGLTRFIYQGQVTLTPCADWTISYSLCCRNYSNTIDDPEGAYLYIQAQLNNLAAPCNSSPTFSNSPSTIFCSGQQFCYNHGALDPDGDSLVYTMTTPFDMGPGGTPPTVTYLPGYTAQQPLPSNPPVTCDPMTGDICMTPTVNIITVVNVTIEQWRRINGVPTLIGTTIRDMQMNVISCSNNLPTLAGINPNASTYNPADSTYWIEVCLGDTVAFDIFAHDDDGTNNLYLTWNQGITGSSFNVTGNGTPSATGSFYWMPNSSFVSNVPHCFTVNVRDDNCPYVGQQTFSYCIVIKGLVVEMDPNLPDSLLCLGDVITLMAHGDTNVVNYHWTVDGTAPPLINDTTISVNTGSLGAGIHNVVITVDDGSTTNCPGVDYITLNVVATPDVDLGTDTTICSNQVLTLDAGPGGQWVWGPVAQYTQTINVNATGYYTVMVDGAVNTRCIDRDTIFVQVLQVTTVDLGPDLCVTDSAVLDAGNVGFEYAWTNGGMPVGADQTYTVFSSGTYSVAVGEQVNQGCDATDQVTVMVLPVPDITLGPDLEVCQHQPTQLEVTGVGINLADYAYTYSWFPASVATPTTVVAWLPEGVNTFIVSVTGCSTVTDTINLNVSICELTIPDIITPNGDGFNDAFNIPNLNYYPDSELLIFNRWGKKIYESPNYQNDWDAESYAAGVYYFVLRVNFGDTGNGQKIEEHHGTLTVLR